MSMSIAKAERYPDPIETITDPLFVWKQVFNFWMNVYMICYGQLLKRPTC